MGRKKRFHIGMQQREKRKKMRQSLIKKGEKVTDYLNGQFYVKIAK